VAVRDREPPSVFDIVQRFLMSECSDVALPQLIGDTWTIDEGGMPRNDDGKCG
jgi:hypothetical protein